MREPAMITLSIEALENLAREAGAEIRRIYEANSYEVNSKAIQTSDSMLATAIGLKR